MDQNLIYIKTPAGNEAIRKRAQLTQRNLRMVLVQVDGKASVATLGARIGNSKLVEDSLSELEERGLVTAVAGSNLNAAASGAMDQVGDKLAADNEGVIDEVSEERARKEKAEEEKAEEERAEKERAEKEKAEKEKAEKEKAEKEKAEKERAEKEKAEKEKAEKERAEKERAEKERAEKERAEKEKAEKEKAEKEKAEKEKAEKEKAEKEKAEKEKAEKERAEKERAEKERAEKEKAEKEKAEKERAEKERAERKRVEKETAKLEKAERKAATSYSQGPRIGVKQVAVLFLLIILAAGLSMIFFPYGRFKPGMETELQRALQVPVRIGEVSLGILPRPALILRRLEIGESQTISIESVRLPLAAAMLNAQQRAFPVVEVDNLTLPVEAVALLTRFSPRSADQPGGFSVGRVNFRHLALSMADSALPKFEGRLSFTDVGTTEKLHLETEDRTLRVDIQPGADGISLEIDGAAWKPFGDASYAFDSLRAKGYLQSNRLTLRDVDAIVAGGKLRGEIFLDWSKGLTLTGDGALDRVSAARAAEIAVPGLNIAGELSGRLILKGGAGDWSTLRSNLEWALDADIVRGNLGGLDLGESARRGSGQVVRGGTTKFDRLRGVFRGGPQGFAGSDLKLESGPMTASGKILANSERKVDGSFDIKVSSSVMSMRLPVRVSGQWSSLAVAAGR